MAELRTAKWYMEQINDTLDVVKEATSISQSAELHAHIGRLLSAAIQISEYSFKIIAKDEWEFSDDDEDVCFLIE